MPLPYRRMSQVPEALIRYVADLGDGAFFVDGGGRLMRVVMDAAARLAPGEYVGIQLDNAHFVDEDARATLALTMNDRQQIAWELKFSGGEE